MSYGTRSKPQPVTLCDICDEEIADEPHGARASLVDAYYPKAPAGKRVSWWYLLWNPRNWTGRRGPSFEEAHQNPRWRYRHYDMHVECLLPLIEHHIAARENAQKETP
jgi:hypothetical protein